jgi:hypothetical protein
MSILKHVGRVATTKRRVVVAYRVVPDEPDNCIVVTTEALPADEHDALMKIVESPAGQEANDFAIVMARSTVPDGRNMLAHFHATGKLMKLRTDQVEMVPNRNTTIMLNELNEMVARQLGVTVGDLAIADGSGRKKVEAAPVPAPTVVVEPLSDEEFAKQLRGQADAMFKEAKKLRDQADELSPIKKATSKKTDKAEESI